MRSRRIGLLGALFVASFIVAPARAEVLVDHPFGSDAGWCSPCDDTYRVWDSFDLSDASTVSSIEARLDIEPDAYVGDISFSIWNADRTTQLFSQSFGLADLALAATPENEFYFDAKANIASWSLAAGTYALSIFGDAGNILGWVQSSQTASGRSFQTQNGGGSGLDMSFRVNGDVVSVPEPTTLALFAAGLIGLALVRRRRQPVRADR